MLERLFREPGRVAGEIVMVVGIVWVIVQVLAIITGFIAGAMGWISVVTFVAGVMIGVTVAALFVLIVTELVLSRIFADSEEEELEEE